MITLDIKDLYVNIPIKETLTITKSLLLENNDEHTTKQILALLETILQQNYFSFQNNTYQPEKGVSMGSPISKTIAEIFLEYLENAHLKQILETKNIRFYARHVDDMLMICNAKHTAPQTIHNLINKTHPNLQFTPTHEHKNSISFLDLLLIRQHDKIEIDILRKPTTTDTKINYTSNHSIEHKMAAFRYLTNRMISLPLTTERKKMEWQKILSIKENNKFPLHFIEQLKTQIQHKTHKDKTNNRNKKLTTFTYHSPKVRKVTNLFKQTDIKTAFKSKNKIQQQTRPGNHETTPGQNKSGIY
jgi:hypothetical protein